MTTGMTLTTTAKAIFGIAVTFIAVAPRMPFDYPCSIGGNLSFGFRNVLLLLTTLNLVRRFLPLGLVPDLIIQALEGIIEAFLGLLTPYLLRVWLSNRVNFPGHGKGLSKWIYAVTALCCIGVVGKATRGDDFWIFKKVADAITYIPTVATLRTYNLITSPGGQYPGRGSILSQTILAAERYALLSHMADVIVKILHLSTFLTLSDDRYQNIVDHVAINSFFAIYTRILCHSILINSLDESFHYRPSTAEEESATDEHHCETPTTALVAVPLNKNGLSVSTDDAITENPV